MPDREKVIKGLECAIGIRGRKNCDGCPYDNDFNCLGCDIVMRDAIALLKEQEAVVRCKDCKHWWYGNYCDKHGKGQENADWFCADGERKDSTK